MPQSQPKTCEAITPIRREFLRNLLSELRDKHQQLAEAEKRKDNWASHGVTAALVVAGGIFFTTRGSSWAGIVFGGICAGVVASAVSWMWLAGQRQDLEDSVERLVTQIQKEFPEQTQLWGGVALLRDPQACKSIVEQFTATPEAP
jgi:hypothetical protein